MSLQSVINTVAAADVAGFRFINDTLYVRWIADSLYTIGRDQLILVFLIGSGAAYFFIARWKQALHVAAWSAVAVLATNLLHNHLLKLFFNRARPFLKIEDVHLCVPLNDLATVSLSFPSTHAASAAALATVAMRLDPRLRLPGLAFAGIIGLGTIYSGGHYPLDVLVGYGIGILIGLLIARLARLVRFSLMPSQTGIQGEGSVQP